MPRLPKFHKDKPYIRVFVKLPKDLVKALQRLNEDIQKIAPYADPERIFKRVTRQRYGQYYTVGFWTYEPKGHLEAQVSTFGHSISGVTVYQPKTSLIKKTS